MSTDGQHRTRARAREVVLQHLADGVASIEDDSARPIFTAQLLEAVFDLAWRHQFDPDRGPFRQAAAQAVQMAIEEAEVGGRDED